MEVRRARRGRFKYLAFIIILAVSAAVSIRYLVVEEDQYTPSVHQLYAEVSPGVAEVRGLSVPEGVKIEIITADRAKDWGMTYVKETSEEIERREIIYEALFLIPMDTDLGEIKASEFSFYLAAVTENRLYVVKDYFDPSNTIASKRILAHETIHLIQGEHFETPIRHTYDEEQAWSALVEGDADFTASTYMEQGIDNSTASTGWQQAYGLEVPSSIEALSRFQYEYGKRFVEALFDAGGWERVNEAYRNPPVSTYEVMHAQAYLSGVRPFEVEAILLDSFQGERDAGDTLGEHFILVMLETWIPQEEAVKASEGWRGDNFTLYRGFDDYFFTWRIEWSSQEDASEFYDATLSMIEELKGEEVAPNIWRVDERHISVIQQGSTTILMGSSDEGALRDALRRD